MSNPFLKASMEENTLDANDNNPLLKAEDPAKAAEEDGAKIADDFEYVDSEAVDGENQKPDEAIIQGEEGEIVGVLNNIVEETAKDSDTISALASVAQEMYSVIQSRGKLLPVEAMVVGKLVQSFESAMPVLSEAESQMPSMESFKVVGMQYTQSQVSLEGVLERLDRGINNLGLNIDRLFKNGVGLARSMTPIIDAQIQRANTVKSNIDKSLRDAGQKEIGGSFVKALRVDGRAPDATTVVKTAAYLNQCLTEVLSDKATVAASRYIKAAQANVLESIDLEKIDRPNIWINFALLMIPGVGGMLESIKTSFDVNKVLKQLRIDGTVSPELFKMYPNISKVAHSGANKNLDYRRSLPLFGNSSIVISQYKPQATQNLHRHEVPSITIEKDGRGEGRMMQTLTSAQQADVVDSAISILTTSREYFKNYANRNADCMRAYQNAYEQRHKFWKNNSGTENALSRAIVVNLFEFYTGLFWRGIFRRQAELSIYGRRTAKAMIDFVANSAAANKNGSPKASQEAVAIAEEVKNPFM